MATIGTVELIAKIDTSQYQKGADDIKRANNDIEGSADTTEKKSNAAFGKIAKVGLAALATAAVAAGAMIVKNIGNAVSRVDTLNNFPKVMGNLGYGTDEATKAIEALDKGTRGLPTTIDGIASALQNIAPSTSDLSTATDLTIALNNALVAGGKSAGEQSSAMEQWSQAIAKGKPDMMEWRSLATAMPGQLKQISNSLGFDGWQKLAESVTDGTTSLDDVNQAFIDLNKNGLGSFPSFADQAQNAAGGLDSGISRMNTAITRGIADIINTIGSENIANAVAGIGTAFENALMGVSGFINFIKENKDIFAPIAVGILTVVSALTAWNVITKIVAVSQAILNAVMNANPIGFIVKAIAALVVGLIYFFTQTETGKAVFQTVMDFIGKAIEFVVGVFTGAWQVISGVWNGVTNFFKGIWDGIVAIFTPVVDFYVGIYSAAWDGIVAIWNGVVGFFDGIWNGIVSVFSVVGSFFSDIFSGAWENVKNAFNTVGSFFRGIWDTIKNIFGTIGTAIGDAVGGAFKTVVNSIIGFAEDTINTFIKGINTVIDVINAIPGVNLGKVGLLNIPRLAEGGVVTARPGGILANIGEGGEDEAVIPLSKLDKMLNNEGGGKSAEYNIGTINIASEVDGERWLQRLTGDSEITSHGLVPTQSYMGAR